jgi:cystathionine gamma-synthase
LGRSGAGFALGGLSEIEMRDLLTDPLCREEDLGSPIPDTDFGVSVCLPRWRHVIGYEEKDPEVVRHFRSGYPRFCCPPAIGALFEAAERELAVAGERCLVFPRESHARRCLEFIAKQTGEAVGRAVVWREEGFGAAVFPENLYDTARKFWRFCGEVVSTRQAVSALNGGAAVKDATQGRVASRLICERLAGFSGQAPEDVFLFPSGMAANFAVHRMLTALRPGCRTVQLDFPYVDVLKLQECFGSGVQFLPLSSEADYEGELRPLLRGESLAGVFAEAPSNPLLRCVDLPRVRAMMDLEQAEVPLVIDDTIATVVNVDAFRFADVVTTSLTKAFSGVGDVLAGCVILNRASRFYEVFSAFLAREADHELWIGDAVALESNSRDFERRVKVMSENASALAGFLESQAQVQRVCYTRRDGGVGYEAIRRAGGGYGGLLSFVLKDAKRVSPSYFDRLNVSKGPSLGTNFTLACPYTLLAHYDELDWAESCGVDRFLIRVSAGLEPVEELVRRFDCF